MFCQPLGCQHYNEFTYILLRYKYYDFDSFQLPHIAFISGPEVETCGATSQPEREALSPSHTLFRLLLIAAAIH